MSAKRIPRRRRRKFVEIIPERKGFKYDRARDLYVKLPIMKLTPEQRESIGEFASFKVTDGDPTHPDFFDQIVDRISRHHELVPRIRVLVQARNVFAILVTYGYPLQSYLALLDKGLDEIVRLCRRALVRGFLTSQVRGEDENECLQFLSSQIENGQWSNWLEEFNAAVERCGTQSS
jgi:hypothetical protein